MKQSTFSAVMANSIKNLLQGYTKGIRFVAVLTMLLTMGIGQAWGEEATATLSFANKAQRTSFSTTKQVWEQNGVTFTNNKASSTNNIADYVNPVRLYAGSSVTVACSLGNMTKIVFNANTTGYASALKNSIGNTATVSSKAVTVNLDGTSNTFTVAKLTAQVRLDNISVTYATAATATEYNITYTGDDHITYSGTKPETIKKEDSGFELEFSVDDGYQLNDIQVKMGGQDLVVDEDYLWEEGYLLILPETDITGDIVITFVTVSTCTTNPTVSAGSHSDVTTTTATVSCSGGITSLGSAGCSIESYGFVYGTSTNPTISNTKVQVGTTYTTTSTAFTKELTGLTANTTYYVRPYATNANGTAYGTQTSFKTLELPKYTVTLNAGSGSCATSVTESSAGAGVDLPTPTICDGWTFAGWATSAVATETSSKPATLLTGTYKPTANTTLYAVYQRTEEIEGGGGTENVSRSYTFSEYTAGAQYAEGEEHELDDVLTLTTTQCHFTSELRIYSSDTHNGYVVSNQLPGRIISIGFNAGNKVDKIAVYGSTNGTAWTEVGKVGVTSTSYANYSLSFGETNYTYFKLDVVGSNQVRLKSITITWESTTSGGTITTTFYHSTPDCGPSCEQLGAATGLTVETDFVHTDGQTYVKFSWTPADNTKANATKQKLCFGKVGEAGTCVDDLEKNLTWTGDLKSKLEPGEYWWSIQALGDGVNYCDGDVVNGTNFTIEAPTYTVTFNAGSGTCNDESLTETSGGAGVTLPKANPPATCATDGWKFAGWWTESLAETTTSPGELLTAGSNYKPTSDCTLYAVYSYTEAGGSGSTDYVLTNIGDIADDDIVVITMTYKDGTVYALSSSNESSDTPPAPTVTVSDNKLSAEPADALKWNISNSSGTLTIYPNGTTAKWLYCTNSNDGVRIGTNTNKAFTIDASSGYLKNTNTNRYVGVYRTNPDWRCYDNTTGNTANQTLGFYVKSSGGSTTTYNSNPTCLVPVWNGADIDKTALTVNCGERSSMDGAAKITFSKDKIFGFSNPITIEASEGFLVSTSRTPNENYQQSVSQSPLIGTDYPNTFNGKFVYVRAEAPAQSDTDLEGTITIKNNKGETLQTFSVTADVTCTTYTLTLDDRGTKTTAEYYAGASVPKPADPEGVCTDPINYVFDGWSLAPVTDENTTSYEKVTFPFDMPAGKTTLHAVYRYVEEGSGDSGDYVKVTENLDDYSGDYLFVYETGSVAFDGGRNNVDDELDATSNTIEVTINGNTIASNATTDAAKFTIAKVDGGYSIQSASGYYIGWSTADKNGLNANSKYNANYYLNTISNSIISGVKGTLKFNKTSGQERFRYYQSGQETIALYRKAASYLYTTSPVCGPHLVITEGKEIYVTGGNAQAARDLVMAQQKVSYKATRLNTKDGSSGGTAPDVVVANNGITKNGIVTSEVKVTFENTIKEQQTDGTYTITGDIVVTYEAETNNLKEDIQVQLAADYNAEAKDNFTVHARSLPSEFVIVAKSGDKWYALNADMSSSKAQPANGQVTLNDLNNPTEATFAPCNAIYTFEAMPQGAEDRKSVRFIGMENKYLWAASEGNNGVQNYSKAPAADALAYNWKLYTEDNITYHFGNAQNTRMLGLHSTNVAFGMYANGASVVQDIRILPYVEKCIYNYAPTNLTVTDLKGTHVTLTWDGVVGATKYQYSDDATNWTDCGTEPTVTINDLTGGTKYTYYIRAYHEDAGVSQECIDYAEITFTTADCDDVPTNITYTADLNSITVSWTAAAPTATIKYNTKEDGTGGGGIINNATSPYKISGGLDKNTTYYIQILAGGTCASPIIPVKTEDVEVDIVEWQPQGIIVDINTDETIGVTLENEVSYGSGLSSLAEDLFFSKYFEGSGSLKMIAIYNGTGKDVDLSEYRIDRGSNGDATNISKTYDLSQLGIIKQGQEIIFYSWPLTSEDSYSCSQSFLDGKVQESGLDANPRWILCDAKTHNGIEFEAMDFSGNDPLLLYKSSELIDVFGVSTEQESPASTQICSGRSDQAWSADGVTNMDYGKTTEDFPNGEIPHGVNVDDETITAYTARVIMFRKNTVVSGKNAVTKNTTTFATFAEEWEARQVCRSGDDGDLTCAAYQELGTFDYSDYYTKYETMGDEQEFDENARNDDGTVTIPIKDLYKRACSNIRVKLTDSVGEVLTDREYKVPIMITTTQGTDGEAFIALQDNLAMMEITGDGDTIYHPLELNDVREICKTCDVVIRDSATLTKVTDGTENDHPQVHDVIVYEGASIVIPDGDDHNYTINSLSLRRKGDNVASAQVQGTGKLVLPADVPVTLNMRIDANNWHWFTLPYDCDIADVTWSDGTPAKYNTDWFLMYYDGESRAASTNPHDNHWKVYNDTTIEAGKGYIIGITGDLAHSDYTFELRFPMAQDVLTAEKGDKEVAVNAWGVQSDNTPNNLGWNLVGNPYLNYYKTADEYSLAGLPLIEYTGIDPVTGDRLYNKNSGNVPFLVTPIDGGWYEYQQELASDVEMMPFTAYFVQVGDPANENHTDGMELYAKFVPDHRGRMSLIRRTPQEVDGEHEPVIVRVEVANAKGESDKTTLIIDDRFTNEYEMNADFFKWFGDYYRRYTKPVLYSMGADAGKRAFNALSEQLAAQPIPLGMFAAQAGDYTFTLTRKRCDLSSVEEVWLYDATTATYTNLMQQDYTFTTAKTEGEGRFYLSVKLRQNAPTDITDIYGGNIVASAKDGQILVSGLNDNTQLWIYDATGKLLHTEQTTNFQHVYEVPVVGTYFVRTLLAGQAQTIKVLVE